MQRMLIVMKRMLQIKVHRPIVDVSYFASMQVTFLRIIYYQTIIYTSLRIHFLLLSSLCIRVRRKAVGSQTVTITMKLRTYLHTRHSFPSPIYNNYNSNYIPAKKLVVLSL